MQDLLLLGTFPTLAQNLIDTEFRCHNMAALETDDALRTSLRGIITRSNCAVPKDVILQLPNLGIIATCGVGYDLIPLDVAAQRNVIVTNTPDVLNDAVAELCVGLLFALLRRIGEGDGFVRSGAWRNGAFPLGVSLAGKHVGIVGLGRIGKEIANRLVPFGVKLSYYGRTDQQLDWPFQPDLHELARRSDILILTSPGGRETEQMIDASVLEALGPQGYLINIARGSVVHQSQLIDALASGMIAGAALDVFDSEPDIDPRFFELNNVVLSPHVGSATNETRMAMARLTLDNLHRFFEDGTVLTPVAA
ncbi:2-hydroxyacid dehydrogenase [Glaciimonas sp. PCH181]|nr:2-hydroxyacid dehydrogenase [Glaciimonas sp. PCH181]PUA20783.1 2-hydroxyacid dehydrogenase [Glaciimonas sp. PCH181]